MDRVEPLKVSFEGVHISLVDLDIFDGVCALDDCRRLIVDAGDKERPLHNKVVHLDGCGSVDNTH